jgi:hypothetical protein
MLKVVSQEVDIFDPNGLTAGGRIAFMEKDIMIVWMYFALSNPTGGTSTLLPQGLYAKIGRATAFSGAISAMLIFLQTHRPGIHQIGTSYNGITITSFMTQQTIFGRQ